MTTLKAPDGVCGVTVNGKEFDVVDGLIEDLDHADATALLAHDPGFAVHSDGVELSEETDPAKMTRKELFAALRKLGIAATATLTTDKLREIFVEHSKVEEKKVEPPTIEKAEASATAEEPKPQEEAGSAAAGPTS